MTIKRKVRVLVIDDSLLFREAIASALEMDAGIEVIGKATDAFDARDKIIELDPEVLALDLEMPKMNGIEFLRLLMPQYPLPVVVCSSASELVFDAMKAGAVDFVLKPNATHLDAMKSFTNELIIKIKIASTAKVGNAKKDYKPQSTLNHSENNKDTVIAIGASTGGTEAIFSVIKAFPRDMQGVVVVQHMPPVFTRMYAERLNNSCTMEVVEAKDGDEVRRGRVLIAPGDFQMQLKKSRAGYFVKVFKSEKVSGHCPSVDVLFNSVAEVAGKNAVGIILTGMGSDGAKGLLEMKNKGALTIGQDESSCVVYGMPMVAYNIGAVKVQTSLETISKVVCDYLRTEE
jgi:two-component system chemotaxis response regulator CheB